MHVVPTSLPDVVLLRLDVHRDDRGWLAESFRSDVFARVGLPTHFAQENRTRSAQGVLRGLHFQEHHAQGKLVAVLAGAIYDVAVDLRAGSPTRGQWMACELSDDDPTQLWIPPGFAHGFYVSRGPAVVNYKLTAAYSPQHDRCLAWDDPTVAVTWPCSTPPILSERDRGGMAWADVPPWRSGSSEVAP